jgi:hypothetical protein
VTDPQLIVKPSFWGELFTAPRLITFAVCIAGGGAWVQSQRSAVEQLRDRVAALELRVTNEVKLASEVYMRRDNLSYELILIRDELTRQRVQIEGLRKDLR